ncbi:Cupin domain family protein [Aspergillus niger]|uniref:Cupin domain family protein n=1 Tax=Aspergillus niger TaxID=5061 RepID=A0A505I3L3_ASPNG|nr:Cupin domain family protein [Aspergillus niger]
MNGEPSAQRPGGRARSACDLCRRKKIRCDNAQPACETCSFGGVQCTYTEHPSLLRKSLRDQLLDARARIRELETQLTVRELSPDSGHREHGTSNERSATTRLPLFAVDYLPNTHSIDASLATFQAEIAHCGVGEPGSTKRASFFSTVYQKTGAQLDLDHFLAQAARSLGFRGSQSRLGLNRSLSPTWPPKPLVQYSINYYSRSGLYSIFPVANVDALSQLIEAGVLDHQHDTVSASNLACLSAFTAMMSVMHRLSPDFVNAEPDAYIQAALGLVPRLLMETPTVRSLEAVVLIMTYVMPSGKIETGQLLLSLATRMILTLGAHRMSVMSEPEGRHLRALFWFCYGADKNMIIRYNQSPHFTDEDCDLQIPDNYVLSSSDNQFFSRPLSNNELLFPSDVRLSLLKSKVYHLLYSRHARALPEARRLQYIRELDQELNDLKCTFPASCWPDLFATPSAPNYTFHDLSMRGVCLHLEFYFLLGKIHEASPLLKSNSNSSSWSILPSSAELFHQESRSILIYIRHNDSALAVYLLPPCWSQMGDHRSASLSLSAGLRTQRVSSIEIQNSGTEQACNISHSSTLPGLNVIYPEGTQLGETTSSIDIAQRIFDEEETGRVRTDATLPGDVAASNPNLGDLTWRLKKIKLRS